MNRHNWLSVGAIVGWLILAFLLDSIAGRVHLYINRTFQFTLPYLFLAFLDLVFAGAAVFLFWWQLIRNGKSLLIGWISLVLGLIVFILASALWTQILASQSQVLRADLFNLEQQMPIISGFFALITKMLSLARWTDLGFLSKAAAITLVIGVINLFHKPKVISPV